MFLSAVNKDSSNLRRRHQSRQSHGMHRFAPHDMATELDGLGAELDLSIHQSGPPSSNRFSGLASLPPAHFRDRGFVASGPRRRSRNTRGSKEAKKRRDARRNKRKFAAQLLDEQLSQEIDETLTRANIPAPPAILSTLFSLAPMAFFSQPWPTSTWPQVPPTPPQLPLLDFSDMDLSDFPYLTATKPPPFASSPSPPAMTSRVPKWCPQIPSLINDGQWNGNLPKFTDLSGLAEQKPLSAPPSQQLQLWRQPADLQKRKQSRFFPSAVRKPIVRLPATATPCKLHHSETNLQDSKTTAWTIRSSRPDRPSKIPRFGGPASSDYREAVAPDSNDTTSNIDVGGLPSAANLWHILADRHARCSTEDSEGGGVPLASIKSQPILLPELDGRELPYVHLNSLVGHSNEAADNHTSAHRLHDSAMYLTGLFACPENKDVIHELPAHPPEQLTADHIEVLDHNTRISDEMANCASQFDSEKQLFEANAKPLPESRADSMCDLKTFLSMGHVENCWCRDCEESPELIEQEELAENDEWTDWSIADEESHFETPPSSAPTQSCAATDVTDEEEEVTRHPCVSALEWNELFATAPSVRAAREDVFLRYCDEGLEFEEELEEDWDWSC